MTTITYERAPKTVSRYIGGGTTMPGRTVYDYKVMIDGEHRATFRNQAVYHQTGFTLYDGTDKPFAHDVRHIDPTRANFDEIVRKVLPNIASAAEIERHRLIEQAWKDNQAFNEDRERNKARIHREMLSDALSQYIENANHPEEQTDEERAKIAAAETMLDQVNARIAEAAK